MHHNHRDHEGAQKLYSLMKDVKICMMTTVEPDGSLDSRPMYCMEADEAGDLWFFTKLHSPKTAEISRDNQINLAYSDPSSQNYVSVAEALDLTRGELYTLARNSLEASFLDERHKASLVDELDRYFQDEPA